MRHPWISTWCSAAALCACTAGGKPSTEPTDPPGPPDRVDTGATEDTEDTDTTEDTETTEDTDTGSPETPGLEIRRMSFGADFAIDGSTGQFVPYLGPDGKPLRPIWWVVWGSEFWKESCASVAYLEEAVLEAGTGDHPFVFTVPETPEGWSDCEEKGFEPSASLRTATR